MDQTERDLIEQATLLSTREEYIAWEQRCDEFIESLEEQSAVINSNHIEPRQFLEDASEIVLERVRDVMQRHNSVKINTVFNGEFVSGDKHANKSVSTRNYELFRSCLHYFSSSAKLELHSTDCGKLNDCAIRLPSEDDKWLKFKNHCRKERVPFVVYADLECVLEKMDTESTSSTYTYQHHQVFSIAYYVHCSYDSSLSGYKFRRDNNYSYKFLASSLEKLASFLSKDKLRVVQREFCNLSAENFDLLTRKGIFPYEYIDSVEKLDDTCLPPRESFYSSLTDSTVSESDYAHALNVWQQFSIRTLGEYSDLYLKTDVLLLTDIFENFRDSCVASYGLDPAYYYTLPGFTWDAMLKHTGVKFELLTDVDMVLFIERGIRGGLSQCSNRYAQANNKYMQSYDPSKPSTYLMYYDVNNLYGWAMCQPLPYADFQWVDDVENFDVTTVALDSPTGYILEVDLEYPQHLHDVHADLPFCPTREKPPGKREDKLLATLCDKQRYVIHYRNLHQCTRHGLRITKIHRILRFTQSPWLRDYIELNTKFRTLAKNDFEKNLYKLMNNAVFGKTMENVRDRVDVKLLTKWVGRYGAEAMIAKPNFHSSSIFSENLVAIELRKLEVKFDKPIYVGMCILDISKTCLYEFHHEYMAPLFRENCKIMYTDTDSLIYHVECDDVYEIIKRDINRFDTSDYAVDNAYGIPLVNKKVPGLMKDENNGAIMSEFVGLRAKMYALRVQGKMPWGHYQCK
ncbi:hypothetical protein ALC62_01044 [Cyphomyrmex costatus]|uniref:DNA-directed DNA polymerase n=1 Tax=Cyphomyrmex costatus TaxID=456900 RepID=A0A151IPQ3_9HYME|nr:hypothetical protein ALC62_01044 [Cyphomyrmex costatus]